MKGTGHIDVFAVRKEGLKIAKSLLRLGNVTVHPPEVIRGGGLKKKAAGAWKRSGALVFIGAAGIAVRTIAPLVRDKATDPAVVVIDDAKRFAVSLLSGHLGGANDLAVRIAALIGADPIVTTATDSMGLPSVEEMARKFDLKIDGTGKIKKINSAILDNKKVFIIDKDRARLASIKKAFGSFDCFSFSRAFPSGKEGVFVAITPFTGGVPQRSRARTLVLRPGEFVVGIGCGRGVGAGEIERAFGAALRKSGISTASVSKLATIDIKKNEPGLLRFAEKRALEVDFFSPGELNKRAGKISETVLKHTGAGGVSEPAALLGAKAKRLWARKITVGKVTVALARAPFTSSE